MASPAHDWAPTRSTRSSGEISRATSALVYGNDHYSVHNLDTADVMYGQRGVQFSREAVPVRRNGGSRACVAPQGQLSTYGTVAELPMNRDTIVGYVGR